MTRIPCYRVLCSILALFLIGIVISVTPSLQKDIPVAAQAAIGNKLNGPIIGQPVQAVVWNGDVRDLPQIDIVTPSMADLPAPVSINLPSVAPKTWIDPLAQTLQGTGLMPGPLSSFQGVSINESGGWHPPDTNGDVGNTYYVQVVNIAVGIFRKSDGAKMAVISFDTLFGGTGTPCDNQNRGDVVALYDTMADRWIVSDFSLPSGGPYWECIAVSQTDDPLGGGWYFYALNTTNGNGSWHDYPKLGVWPDAYYMSANMFSPDLGAKVWALDRTAMLSGNPMNYVSFDLGSSYWSLLPANMKGAQPPAGSPNYFVTSSFPNTLSLWKFHVDWATPGNSTITGPLDLTVADFGYIGSIPQPSPGSTLDSLGDRLMFSLHYRNRGSYESLWVNQTVSSGGVAGVRWYEIRDPNGTPFVYQQGTYQPDNSYRWMGSVATDQDGNMALGYSVSSNALKPAVRYAGRLVSDPLGELPQGENSLVEGGGVQTGSNRWGDYSLMSVDPVDDCTFWYTQEYVEVTSGNWNTRIGSFKFPSCGQPKGTLEGHAYNAISGVPISGVLISAEVPTMTFTTLTDPDGYYTITLPAETYTVTAGPLLPGYPDAEIVAGVAVSVGNTTVQDFQLNPAPYLVGDTASIEDNVLHGNGNGFPEPGEAGILLREGLLNTGAITSTQIMAYLESLTPGVTVNSAQAAYADIGAGESLTNTDAFVISIDPSIPCGADLNFHETVTDSINIYSVDFSLNASYLLPRQDVFFNDVEAGVAGWTTGGVNNLWNITANESHSPTHSWTDSPAGNYQDNTNSWLRSPIYNLSGLRRIRVSAWIKYDLEAGWDYLYVEYSTDGGTNWTSLEGFTGQLSTWEQISYEVPELDNQANARIRFHLVSDGSVNADGVYIDDIAMSYEPYICEYPIMPAAPDLVSPSNGAVTTESLVPFVWSEGIPGAIPTGYILNIDAMPAVTVTYPLTSAVFTLTEGVHNWFVSAYNEIGQSASATWTVTVSSGAPGVPVLIAPVDQTITTSKVVTFTWMAGSGAIPDGYYFLLDGEVITLTENLPQLVVTLTPGMHTWRVAAYIGDMASAYTDAWVVYISYPVYLPLVEK